MKRLVKGVVSSGVDHCRVLTSKDGIESELFKLVVNGNSVDLILNETTPDLTGEQALREHLEKKKAARR